MNALTGQSLYEETIDYVDLLLQRLQWLQRFTQGHCSALAVRAPVVFVDAVSHEDDAESLGKCRLRGFRGEDVKRLKPRQSHRAANAAKHCPTRNNTVGFS